MARKAIKNTYGYETIGGVEVRRIIRAGKLIPPTYRVHEGAYEEVPDQEGPAASVMGAVVKPPDKPDPDDANPEATTGTTQQDYESLTVPLLEDQIKERGLQENVPSDPRKADLIEVLEEADAEQAEAHGE